MEGKENMIEVIDQKEVAILNPSPIDMAQSFLTAGGDLATLKDMMVLQREHDAYEAKKAFIRAMAKFKEEPIYIQKDKENKQYNSKYSSIGATVNACLPRMGKCGLSHKWEFVQADPKTMTGTCVVTHQDGHSDSVSMTSPIDTSGNKNPIQQIKSTRTYIKIETFSSLMGLASSDTDLDDDGNAAGTFYKPLTADQAIDINDRLKDTGSNVKLFLSMFKVNTVEEIPMDSYGVALKKLQQKADAQAKAVKA